MIWVENNEKSSNPFIFLSVYFIKATKNGLLCIFLQQSIFIKRLRENEKTIIFKDFAHAPSKLLATSKAVVKQFPKRKVIACLELHTFSSLNKNFLSQYEDTFDKPDVSIVYYNPDTLKHKNLPEITPADIRKGFNKSKLEVFTQRSKLQEYLKSLDLTDCVLLLMSSGNFGGINLKEFANQLIK